MHVCLVGQSPWFGGLRSALARSLGDLGHSVEEREGMPPVQESDVLLVLGPHDFGPPPKGGRTACIWTEQDASKVHFEARRRASLLYGTVFDIHRRRAEKSGAHFLPAWAEWDACQRDLEIGKEDRPIDVLFYGTSTKRRAEILRAITDKVAVESPDFFLSGEKKRSALRLAKVVLNLHAYDVPSHEPFRIVEAASCGTLIVSETQSDPFPWVPGEDFLAIGSEMIDGAVLYALEHYDEMAKIRSAALEKSRTFDSTHAARTIMEVVEAPAPV